MPQKYKKKKIPVIKIVIIFAPTVANWRIKRHTIKTYKVTKAYDPSQVQAQTLGQISVVITTKSLNQ